MTIDVPRAIEAIEQVLARSRGKVSTVTPETQLEDLGLTSMEVVEVFVVLEEMTGCVVSASELQDVRVVADLGGVPCLRPTGR